MNSSGMKKNLAKGSANKKSSSSSSDFPRLQAPSPGENNNNKNNNNSNNNNHNNNNKNNNNNNNGGPLGGRPSTLQYLSELLQDLNILKLMGHDFQHVSGLLQKEISRVSANLAKVSTLPPPQGPIVLLNQKIYIPVTENPKRNFVGRLIGPRGKTAKQLEAETGCKIMVRGKGSMRNKKEEELNRGKKNFEHLKDDLHVIVSAKDYENRAEIRLKEAVKEVKKFLEPWNEGEDELKARQLMELACIKNSAANSQKQKQTHNYFQVKTFPNLNSSSSGRQTETAPVSNANIFAESIKKMESLGLLNRNLIGDTSTNEQLRSMFRTIPGMDLNKALLAYSTMLENGVPCCTDLTNRNEPIFSINPNLPNASSLQNTPGSFRRQNLNFNFNFNPGSMFSMGCQQLNTNNPIDGPENFARNLAHMEQTNLTSFGEQLLFSGSVFPNKNRGIFGNYKQQN